ncbi:Hint domain-containing protein [Sulfitobacter sp. HNIBRBA3233]|uniref:Hint domain-containing protein n=1 Tax=Sulfitobacter marinivivus TaxID=3158558 RepID=UPI0032E0504A
MPTTYKDQFYRVDPGNPPARGTPLTVFRAEMTDVNDNGLIDDNDGDLFNGLLITNVWEGDTLTVRIPGIGNVTYTGTTFYLSNGEAVFTPTDGQILQDGEFRRASAVTVSTEMDVGSLGPTCFTPGAQIAVPGGTRAIEDIAIGDLVETLDNGPQPVRMVLRVDARAFEKYAPIVFERGALGNDRTFAVSPEHRMLIGDWRAALWTGCDDVLVAAKHLVNGTTVRRVEGGTVTYLHLVFDAHQIVVADDCPSESCLPGGIADDPTDPSYAETLSLFPDFAKSVAHPRAVRTVARKAEAICLNAA